MNRNSLNGKPANYYVNPATYSNSGSRAFSGQQAQIFKIIFFNEENDLEYNDYVNNKNYSQQTPITSTPFVLTQEAPPPKVNVYHC